MRLCRNNSKLKCLEQWLNQIILEFMPILEFMLFSYNRNIHCCKYQDGQYNCEISATKILGIHIDKRLIVKII